MPVNPVILVTGSNGQLGKELQQFSSSFAQFNFIFLSREELPVNDPGLISHFFTKHQPQYCINCAAYTAVDKAEEEKEIAFQVNAEAVGVLATVSKENNCRLIHISTDYVFDGASIVPYKEDDTVNPQGVYGASKLEGERLALQNNADVIIIRTSWVYSEFGKNFVKTMMRLMSEKDKINVVNDQIGSPTYAADLAEVILHIIFSQKWKPGIYNYSNKGIISWYEFAVTIKELIKSNCIINPIPASAYPTPAKRPAYSVLDTEKIQTSFGIEIKDWKESLRVCLSAIK